MGKIRFIRLVVKGTVKTIKVSQGTKRSLKCIKGKSGTGGHWAAYVKKAANLWKEQLEKIRKYLTKSDEEIIKELEAEGKKLRNGQNKLDNNPINGDVQQNLNLLHDVRSQYGKYSTYNKGYNIMPKGRNGWGCI